MIILSFIVTSCTTGRTVISTSQFNLSNRYKYVYIPEYNTSDREFDDVKLSVANMIREATRYQVISKEEMTNNDLTSEVLVPEINVATYSTFWGSVWNSMIPDRFHEEVITVSFLDNNTQDIVAVIKSNKESDIKKRLYIFFGKTYVDKYQDKQSYLYYQ